MPVTSPHDAYWHHAHVREGVGLVMHWRHACIFSFVTRRHASLRIPFNQTISVAQLSDDGVVSSEQGSIPVGYLSESSRPQSTVNSSNYGIKLPACTMCDQHCQGCNCSPPCGNQRALQERRVLLQLMLQSGRNPKQVTGGHRAKEAHDVFPPL